MKRRKKYLKLTALVLSMVMLLACIPVYAEPVGDVQQQQQSQASTPASGDTPQEVVEVSQTVIESSQSQLNGGIATASTGSSYTWYDETYVPDGIYAFKNYGNANRWMDVQGDMTTPGYHMQQYAYGSTPAGGTSYPGLYKVTRVNDSLGLYTIRLMINTNLTFYISGTEVLTKTISSNDSAVSISDMFYIESVNGGYVIRPYGSNYCISAKNTTASGGGGAPDSYLTPRTYSEAGSRAVWVIEGHRTFIDEGVYAFENRYVTNCWIDTEQDFSDPGHYLQQYDYGDIPTVNFNRGALFKIAEDEQNDGLYIIRSMLNNRLSFTYSGEEVITHQIPYNDNNVSVYDMYYIVFWNGSYYIRAYGESMVIATNQGAYFGQSGMPASRLDLYEPSEIGDMGQWDLVKYVGVHQYGKKVIYTGNFVAGETVEIETRIWSTFINVNDYTSTLAGDQDIRTARWYGGTGQYRDHWEVDLHDEGTITVHTHLIYDQDNYTNYWLDIDKNIGLPVEEGIYNFKNKQLGNYMQVDDDEPDYTTEGAVLELQPFASGSHQRWQLVHERDGYYKIKSVRSGYYVSVQASLLGEPDESLLQLREYEDNSRQLWKFTKYTDGTYVIRPKSGESYDEDFCMAAGSAAWGFEAVTDGRNVEQREYDNDGDYFEHWYLVLPMSGDELPYQPELWNSNELIRKNTNCYSYALNNQIYPGENRIGAMNPGLISGIYIQEEDCTEEQVLEAVEADSETLNFKFEEIGKFDVCSAEAYKVALVLDVGTDYHWYRQNSDGTWSHKRGQTAVKLTDENGDVILDPETADRSDGTYDYDCFVGFFEITPLNNMAMTFALVDEAPITLQGTPELLPNKTNLPLRSVANDISEGMSCQEVTEILGLPQRSIGTGFIRFVYDLEDGSSVVIGYSFNGEDEYVCDYIEIKENTIE